MRKRGTEREKVVETGRKRQEERERKKEKDENAKVLNHIYLHVRKSERDK